jgi:hypothetical protein
MDYSPKTAFRQNRALCFRLIDQLDELLNWDGDPDFRDVGDIVEARNHLEYAVQHLGTLGELKRGNKLVNKTSQRLGGAVADSPRRTDSARKLRRRLRNRKRGT